MARATRPWMLAITAALLALPAAAAQRYEGLAYGAKGGPLVYREVHWLYRDAGVPSRLVLYRCPDGRPFARKRMREAPGATAPSFDFVDARSGYREGVRAGATGREIVWQPDARTPLRARPLDVPAGTVIDAGFDAYVRQHWNDIARAPQTVFFLVPSRFDAIRFRIADGGAATYPGRPARTLRMGLAGLLGLALPDLELTYDAADHRLLRFRGPGTVRDAKGRMQMLRIEFPAPPVDVSPAEIEDAANVPLVASCAR